MCVWKDGADCGIVELDWALRYDFRSCRGTLLDVVSFIQLRLKDPRGSMFRLAGSFTTHHHHFPAPDTGYRGTNLLTITRRLARGRAITSIMQTSACDLGEYGNDCD